MSPSGCESILSGEELRGETAELQRSMAQICRSGDLSDLPGAYPDRARVYRDLIFNGIEDALARAYPIAKATLKAKADSGDCNLWESLVVEFVAKVQLKSPQLWQMPRQLYEYVRQGDFAERINCPYLVDLLWFEWVEIEIYNMPDGNDPRLISQQSAMAKDLHAGALHAGALVANQDSCILNFSYPVYAFTGDDLLQRCGEYFIIAYRHPERLDVHFVEVSQLFAQCFELLRQGPKTFAELYQSFVNIAEQQGVEIDEGLAVSLKQEFAAFVENLHNRQLILGAVDQTFSF